MSLEQKIQIGEIPVQSSSIGYGTYHLHDKINPAVAIDTFAAAAEQGVVLFDTSDNYGTELTIGRALDLGELAREQVIVATKTGLATTLQEQLRWTGELDRAQDTSPDRIREQVDASLRMLGDSVGVIDLYQLHAPDDLVSDEAHAETMTELIEACKIREYGLSNYSIAEMAAFIEVCDQQGLRRPVTMQPFTNIATGTAAAYDAFAEQEGMVVLAHSPLYKGSLTKYGREMLDAALRPVANDAEHSFCENAVNLLGMLSILDEIDGMADQHGYSLAQAAIASIASLPNTIALTTPTNSRYLSESVAAADWNIVEDKHLMSAVSRLQNHPAANVFHRVVPALMRDIRKY